MNKEKELKQYLDRIGYFTYEISRLNRALLVVQGGMPFEEAMQEHLLLMKMKNYSNDRKHGNWGDTIRNCRLRAVDDIGWDKKERDTILADYLPDALQDIYEAGVKRYKK